MLAGAVVVRAVRQGGLDPERPDPGAHQQVGARLGRRVRRRGVDRRRLGEAVRVVQLEVAVDLVGRDVVDPLVVLAHRLEQPVRFDAMVGIGTALLALGAWLASSGGAAATSRGRPGSCAPSRSPAPRRSSRSGPAGSSPRSAASRGSSRATCAPPKRSPTAKGIWFSFGLVLLLYAALGRSRSSSCAAMSRRWREGGAEPGVGAPYAPPAEAGA